MPRTLRRSISSKFLSSLGQKCAPITNALVYWYSRGNWGMMIAVSLFASVVTTHNGTARPHYIHGTTIAVSTKRTSYPKSVTPDTKLISWALAAVKQPSASSASTYINRSSTDASVSILQKLLSSILEESDTCIPQR